MKPEAGVFEASVPQFFQERHHSHAASAAVELSFTAILAPTIKIVSVFLVAIGNLSGGNAPARANRAFVEDYLTSTNCDRIALRVDAIVAGVVDHDRGRWSSQRDRREFLAVETRDIKNSRAA